MRSHSRSILMFLVFLLAMAIPSLQAAWVIDGVAICTEEQGQYYSVITTDGYEGAIIVWTDERNGNRDIYAQRIDSDGTVQWDANGVAICTDDSAQWAPRIASDASGGAIVAWCDGRIDTAGDIYAQRVNSAGIVQWDANGVAICACDSAQWVPRIASDASGGAIITWTDRRNWGLDIYAQRVNSAGGVHWGPDGVAICNANKAQNVHGIVSDEVGGAIIMWTDNRLDPAGDIYAQRVNSAGGVQWGPDGVVVCDTSDSQWEPTITSDGNQGAIIAWTDRRDGVTSDDIYAQRVDSDGNCPPTGTSWLSNGVRICTAIGAQSDVDIAPDEAGGAIVTWEDRRSTLTSDDIYTQRIDSNGVVQWAPNGEVVCTADHGQYTPLVVSDGSGGGIITWRDCRSYEYDIYAQGIDSNGNPKWATEDMNGVPVCTAPEYQGWPAQAWPAITADGAGGAVITWTDYRDEIADIYALRVYHDGLPYAGNEEASIRTTFRLNQNHPNPFDRATEITYGLLTNCHVRVEIFDARGRKVAALVDEYQKAGLEVVRWDGKNDVGIGVLGGIYFYRLQAGDFTEVKKMVLLQ